MLFYSLNNKDSKVSFQTALKRGLAPDNGLYFPETIEPLHKDFFQKDLENLDETEVAYNSIKQFISDEIPENELKKIIKSTICFEFPIVEINNSVSALELFHGPTMAFKDVGARFMARCLGYFNRNSNEEITVLVATSGDTGGAVANGFYKVPGIKVVILYPSGKVSNVQEKQLTTLGENITAFEVDGTFDDCQSFVKKAFLDKEINSSRKLTSANSINIGRWLPQMFYYLFAYMKLKNRYKELVFSVPCGNFGNVCAGVVAKKLGFPFKKFVTSNNVNDVFVRFLNSNKYDPVKSIHTISNAMDVGDPSNFVRILALHDYDINKLKKNISAYSFSDKTTEDAIKEIYNETGYIADPHGAIGYLGCKEYLKKNSNAHTIFLETAHPSKFPEIVEKILDRNITIPPQIQAVIKKQKFAKKVKNYDDFRSKLSLI